MGRGHVLRVSKAEEWLRRPPARPGLLTRGDRVVIRSTQCYQGERGAGLTPPDGRGTAGARRLCLHVVMIPPGARGTAHYHEGCERTVYTVSGETEVWHGTGLVRRTVARAGDVMYIPAGVPHLAVNRGDVTAIAVVARTDRAERNSVIVVGLPHHLAGLLSLPIAVQG